MSETEIARFVENYVRNNLSPKQEQRDYIKKKYETLCGFLGDCFQSGSYARFTAIHPVHDLDIIWVTQNVSVTDHPRSVLTNLAAYLRKKYQELPERQRPSISIESHSITLQFNDSQADFSIDVVPAIAQSQRNEYGDPIYSVPEIQKMSHRHRQSYYSSASATPSWILSDPKGYIKAASNLDATTEGRFRKATKLLKAWRHNCKKIHKDKLKLKSFHLELVVTEFLSAHPRASVVEAAMGVIDLLPQRLQQPYYRDRANHQQYVDSYVSSLTNEERALILTLQSEAHQTLACLSAATSEKEIENVLVSLLKGAAHASRYVAATPTFTATAHRPWSY